MRKRLAKYQFAIRPFIILLTFAAIGFTGISMSGASGFLAGGEAESGALAGKATQATGPSGSGASGMKAVLFGAAALTGIQTPTYLSGFAGGDSIGLIWGMTHMSRDSDAYVSAYDVYRDGVKIATTVRDWDFPGRAWGTQYIDKAVVKGKTYTYQVRAVDAGMQSPLSAPISVTFPTNTSPVPTITLDSSVAANLPADKVTWLKDKLIPHLQTWYPKFSDLWAYPDYTPPSTITLKTASDAEFTQKYGSYNFVTEGSTINFRPAAVNDTFSANYFMEKSIPVLLDRVDDLGTAPYWFYSGMEQYATYYIYNGYEDFETWRSPVVNHPFEYLNNGGTGTASYLYFGAVRYGPKFIRDMNVASHAKKFGPANLKFPDGRGPDEVYQAAGYTHSKTGTLKNIATGKCAAATPDDAQVQAVVVLQTCNGSSAQKTTYRWSDDGLDSFLSIYTFCFDGQSISGVLPYLLTAECTGFENTEKWTPTANGTITHGSDNLCLDIQGESTADGTKLSFATCNGSARQKWAMP